MISGLAITSQEQELILLGIQDIPPSRLLSGLSKSQAEHWQTIRHDFSYLRKYLKAFFNGEHAPSDNLPDYEQNLYDLWSSFYLKLYHVIFIGWEDIRSKYFEQGNKGIYGEVFPCSSPGETLIAIIERDAAAAFWQCKWGRHDFRPRKMYQLRREAKKISQGLTSDKQVKRHQKDVSQLVNPFEIFMDLEHFCVSACRQAAKEKGSKALRRKIKEYEVGREELSELLYQRYRSISGHAWEAGDKKKTTKKGGTYL